MLVNQSMRPQKLMYGAVTVLVRSQAGHNIGLCGSCFWVKIF